MNLWGKMHMKHCELSSFATSFTIVALIVSVYLYFFQNHQFGSNLVYLFGLSTLAGIAGIVFYRYSLKKWPFN